MTVAIERALYKRVPRGFAANLRYRKRLLVECEKSAEFQRAMVAACRRDCLFWIKSFVWQFNPKKKAGGQQRAPFIPYEFQERTIKEIIWCIRHDEDLLIEKSRQMGGSWMMLLVFLWFFLFHDDQSFLLISRNQAMVDSDDPKSLFWKLRFVLEYLPPWLKPKNMQVKQMLLVNHDRNSFIFGEATTKKSGVGSTVTAMGIDEFSQIQNDSEVLRRTSDTSGCRIFNGTHLGLSTEFYQLSKSPDIRKLMLHWTEHPDYNRGTYRWDDKQRKILRLDPDFEYPEGFRFVHEMLPSGGPHPGVRSPWYDKQCKRKKNDLRAIAMDLDIDPTGTTTQFFNQLMVMDLVKKYAEPPVWRGDVRFDRFTGKFTEMVKSEVGRVKLWVQLDGKGRLPRGCYKIGCDIAAGTGNTPSTISVIDARRGLKVLEYQNPEIIPNDFAPLVMALGTMMDDEDGLAAQLVWDALGQTGSLFTREITRLRYPNMWRSWDPVRGWNETPGWFNSGSSRDVKYELLLDYRTALVEGRLLNKSENALRECLKFEYDSNQRIVHGESVNTDDPSAGRMNHGDQVMADALAWMLAKGKGETVPGEPEREKKLEEYAVGTIGWIIAQGREQEESKRVLARGF